METQEPKPGSREIAAAFFEENRLPGGAAEGKRFFDYYQAAGWITKGGLQMNNWKQAARSWHNRNPLRIPLTPRERKPRKPAKVKREIVPVLDIENNAAARYLLTLHSETSRYMQGRKLAKVAEELSGGTITSWDTFPWAQLTPATIQALITSLAGRYKPAYVNGILAAIRGVVEDLYSSERITERAYRQFRKVKPAKLYRSADTLPGRYVKEGERAALMRTCLADTTPAGIRDAAVIACAYPGGLRRAEIAALNREDVKQDGETLTLHVHGKGGKERQVFMDNGGALAVMEWIRSRGDVPGPLFYQVHNNGELNLSITGAGTVGHGITGQTVYNILKKRAKEAGIADLGAHDLRRTTASDLLDIADTVTAAAFLGHSSTNTTAIYDRRGERARRKAAAGLILPYRKA